MTATGPRSSSLKSELRGRMKAARAALDAQRRHDASRSACRHLLDDPWCRSTLPWSLALYAPMADEADPGELVAHARRTAFPRVDRERDRLAWSWSELAALEPLGPWALREPDPKAAAAAWEDIQLVVVPGLAFTERGDRLGYGKGYYDRAIAAARSGTRAPRFVGFAFEAQVLPELPMQAHDQRLDGLVTEAGLRWFI